MLNFLLKYKIVKVIIEDEVIYMFGMYVYYLFMCKYV